MHTQYQHNQKCQPTSNDVEREYNNCASLWGFKKHVFYNGTAQLSAQLHSKDSNVQVRPMNCTNVPDAEKNRTYTEDFCFTNK